MILLHALWCFDIRVPLKETNLLPASGQDGCVESHSPDQIPNGRWATGQFCFLLPSSYLFLPHNHPLTSPARDQSTSSCWKSPCMLKGILHWHSAAISARRDSVQNEYNKHLNLSGACKMTADRLREGNTLTWKMFLPWWLKMYKHGLGAIFQGLSSQTQQDHVCLSWQTGQGLSSMFSIQITIMFGHGTALLF